MQISNLLEKVTYKECKEFASHDSSLLSYNSEIFTQNNTVAYYILCNTWLLIAENISDITEYYLHDLLKKDGVLKTIRNCAEWSDTFLQTGVAPYEAIPLISQCNNTVQMLALLRYGKRFSPRNADVVLTASMEAFLKVNHWCKLKQHYEAPNWLVKLVKFEADKLLKGRFIINDNDCRFSSGASTLIDGQGTHDCPYTFRTSSKFINKIVNWNKCNYGDFMYPNYSFSENLDSDEYREKTNVSVVRAVPKSLKAARIIAIENSNNSYYLQACRQALRNKLVSTGGIQYFDSTNQDRNASLALENSASNEMATIDLSSASDSITVAIARQILPPAILENIFKYRADTLAYSYQVFDQKSKKIKVKSGSVTSHMFLTSGNPCTFECEGIIFTSIALAATHYVELMLGTKVQKPSVFGDDCIVDVRVYDTFCDFLNFLGFKVNTEKSFTGSSKFRESCGTDAYDGQWVSTKYFPRTPLLLSYQKGKLISNAESVESLIQLQHRYYSTFKVQRFIYEVVKLLEPRMTSSLPYTDSSDLWEDFPRCKSRCFSGSLTSRETRITHNKVIYEPWPVIRTEALSILPKDDGKTWEYSAIIERHCEISLRYPKVTINKRQRDVYEMWTYMQYLKHGPLYENKLDELLKVSKSRVNLERDCTKPELVWTPAWRARAEI